MPGKYFKEFSSIILLLLLMSGCRTIGPNEITGTHSLYNQAISTSLDRQLLQNLVRLRYRDTPFFLGVGSVTASLKLEASGGTDSELNTGTGGNLLMPNVGISYSSGPTISYAPLQGEDFLRNLLTPISLESLFVLMQSGWSAKRVIGMTVEKINDLENAPTASGPTPSAPPANQDRFLRLLELLESKRSLDRIQTKIDSSTGELFLLLDETGLETEVTEIKSLLNLNREQKSFKIDGSIFQPNPETISIRTRSIMSILFYLSHNTDTPAEDEAKGLVTVTKTREGNPFDWQQTAAGSQFRVLVSDKEPKGAFLAIPYRGNWFYLDDSDLDSKSSFLLLTQLFNLQAGNINRPGPTLTIPVSQ